MNRRIFNFELNEELVLGFNTGLDVRSFARAKMAQFITQPGSIVYPDGRIETWQPGGVSELPIGVSELSPAVPSMAVWGPPFPGESLIAIINSNRKDEALDALRFWLKARMILEENPGEAMDAPLSGPAGALIVSGEKDQFENDRFKSKNYRLETNAEARLKQQFPHGTVFFPPARLLKRCLQAEGDVALLEAERWVPDGNLGFSTPQGKLHPDPEKEKEISFCAAAMLYRIFCGDAPFISNDRDEQRQNIRERVFLPPNLLAPGLDPQMSELIIRAMSLKTGNATGTTTADKDLKQGPTPLTIGNLIGAPASRPVSSWIKQLSEEEISKIKTEKEQYSRRKTRAVKTRRFMVRYAAIIAVSLAALILILLTVRGIIRDRSELPTTKGMAPLEVAQAYYGAFGDLNHTLMSACVSGKAGKGDINMVMNFFVITKVRGAYEMSPDIFITAEEWIKEGSPVTERSVFGITNLQLSGFQENAESASLVADYILWTPERFDTRDKLELKLIKGAWRITEIRRLTNQ